jgi:hypothetical protein
MEFDPRAYCPDVAGLLEIEGAGHRRMPLVSGVCSSTEAARRLENSGSGALFPGARSPHGALAGLWVYFSDVNRAHAIAQAMPDAEGSYWHAIVHRQEPDAWNSRCCFNHFGRHPVFERLVLEIQRAEWELLFDWCAREARA